jgi:hydroxymethylbilane synthase
LDIRDLRGNLDTRLAKLDSQNLDAIVLAVAGLKRLGWEQRISQILPYSLCLPAVGQGALALEIRQEDQGVVPLLEFLDHEETRAAVTAERAYLHQLAGDCQVPFGVYGQIEDNRLLLEAVILSTDGRRRLTGKISGSTQEAEILGRKLAIQMYDAGGKELLAELHGRCSREEES